MRVSVVGNLKNVQDEYIVEITGEWEHRESGRYWPWQFKVERYTVCDFETPCTNRAAAQTRCIVFAAKRRQRLLPAGRSNVRNAGTGISVSATAARITAISGM